jgi:hypothetical protein
MRKVLLALAILIAPTAYAANDGMYVGVNVVRTTYKEDGFASVNPVVLAAKLGKEFNPNFAIEGRVGLGVMDDSLTIAGTKIDVEVDNFYGVYAKGILPTGSKLSPYGLVGYTKGKISASAGGLSASGSDSDISFGVGADVALDKDMILNFEFAKLFGGDGYDVDALSIGASFRF